MLQKIPHIAFVFVMAIVLSSCRISTKDRKDVNAKDVVTDSIVLEVIQEKELKIDSSKIAFEFDFPVGKPDGKGYYDYQGFTKNNHLGEDWNGVGGGNTDLGDTIYAIANGKVTYAEDFKAGWGNTIRIVHELPDGRSYESVYAHCDTILTMSQTWVHKGEPIGTIGTAHDQYLAHLHLEIREKIGLPIGNGYSADTTGYVNPTTFIRNHREVTIKRDSVSQESD